MVISRDKNDTNTPVYEKALIYKQKFDEVKTPSVIALNHTIFRNNTMTQHIRQKRSLMSKKEQCNALKISSLSTEYTANRASVAATIASSVGIFGSIGAAIFGGFSIGAYTDKYVNDKEYIGKECDDIPFHEIKEILGKRFDQVDSGLEKNYVTVRENLKAIQLNYQAIKHVEDKIDKSLVAMQSGFMKLSDQLHKARTEEVTSKLITFIEHFAAKQNSLKYLPPQELVHELEEENGILYYLKMSKMPQLENSLYELLNDVINRELAVPESADDETAIATLYLLCLGAHTYIAITSLLLNGYNYLIHYNSQKGNTEACNKYHSLSVGMLKDNTVFLNGFEGRDGLIDKVIAVLSKVRVMDFIINEKNDIVQFVSKNIQILTQTKSKLMSMNDFPIKNPTEQIRCNFTNSVQNTYLKVWEYGKRVSYAVQYVSKGVYSRVSEWSATYTFTGNSFPKLDIGVVPQGITRLIFRKFDSDKPQLVGIIDNNEQIEFRDIHRDLYNSALEANEELARLNLDLLIKNGANITATFEKGRQAVHAAAKAGNMRIILDLVAEGADINAKDEDGYAPLHIAAELGYENFIKELISHGANVNAASYLNWTALHVAAERDHVNVIKSLLQTEGIKVNARTVGGFTPMHLAVSSNNKDAIAILMTDERTDVNTRSEKLLTPLHLLVLNGNEEIVETFLSNSEIDTNLGSQGNLTALHLATVAGNGGIVEKLMEHNETDINAVSEDRWTALHLAISLEKETVTRMLLNTTEIEVNAEGNGMLSPMHLACSTGQNYVISALLDRDAELEAVENNGYTPLYFAVKGGHLHTVELLVEKGANFNVKNEKDETPLTLAISSKRTDIITYLINKELVGYDVHNEHNDTLLHYAAYKGCLEIVKYFIDTSQIDLNVKNNLGETALHAAASGNKLYVIKFLIDSNGMDFKAKNIYGNTPLHQAARKGHLKVVRYFTRGNKRENLYVRNNLGDTPLHLAAREGYLDVVKYFIDTKRMDPRIKNKSGFTPLHYAVFQNNLEMLKYLIEVKQFDFNLKENFGRSLLHLAVVSGHVAIVEYLIDVKKIDPYLKTTKGETILHLLVIGGESNSKLDMFDYLIDTRHMDPNVKDSRGLTPLHYAAMLGHVRIVEYLIDEKRVDLNIKTTDTSRTVLHLAAMGESNSNLDIVKYLIDTKHMDPNVRDSNGETPLLCAAFFGRMRIVQYFIDEKRVNRNIMVTFKLPLATVLHYAAKGDRNSNLDVVKYLIETKHFDPNVKDIYGSTPLHYAAEHGHVTVVEYLAGLEEVNLNVKNWFWKTPLDVANSERKRNSLKSKGAGRRRRNAVSDIKTADLGKEKIKLTSGSEIGIERENNVENTKGVKGSHTDILKLRVDKNALISENNFRDYGSRTAPRIENHSDAREYSTRSAMYDATSHENAFLVKWLFYVFGRRSFVKRMNEAEDSRILHEMNHKDGGSSENVYWAEKKLSEAIARYGDE